MLITGDIAGKWPLNGQRERGEGGRGRRRERERETTITCYGEVVWQSNIGHSHLLVRWRWSRDLITTVVCQLLEGETVKQVTGDEDGSTCSASQATPRLCSTTDITAEFSHWERYVMCAVWLRFTSFTYFIYDSVISLQCSDIVGWCANGCVVECRICNRKVAGSNLGRGYFAPSSTQPSIPPGSEMSTSYSWEGKGRYGSFRLWMNVWVCR